MNSKTLAITVVAIVVIAAIVLMLGAARGDMNLPGGAGATSTATTTGAGGAAGSGAGAGSGATGGAATSSLPRTTTIAFGAEGGAGDVTIEPTSLVEDSRCPANVQCVSAGRFIANVILTTNAGTVTRQMQLGRGESIPGGQTVTLTSVAPAAFAGGTPKVDTYRLTFTVSAS